MAKKARIWDGSQWIDIASAVTDLTQYANLTTTPISGFRNAIINGGFDVWQRGTSTPYTGSATVSHSADRLYHYSNGNGSWTFSQGIFTAGAAPVSGYEAQFFARATCGTLGSTTTLNWGQRIEGVRTFAGQTVTVSFWAKADSARIFNFNFEQNFGTGGSTAVTTSTSTVTVSTSWTRYSVSHNVPSVLGKTFGANSFLGVYINSSVTAGFVLDIWGVQVEPGSIATPFEQRPIGVELQLCQRYYVEDFGINDEALPILFNGGYALAQNAYKWLVHKFPVEMRATPVVTFYPQSNSKANPGFARYYTSVGSSAGNLYAPYATTSFNSKMIKYASYNEHNAATVYGFGAAYTASAEL